MKKTDRLLPVVTIVIYYGEKVWDAAARTRTSQEKVSILRFPFLLEEDNVYGGDTPFRTYKGMRYHGGYSDHLPVLLELIVEE